MDKKFKVGKSRFGRGCFATRQIRKGETICFLKGEEIEVSDLKRLDWGTEVWGDPLQVDKKTYIDLDKPYIYFYHSCNPNAGIRRKNKLVAMRNIRSGEEIFYDYSTTMWDNDYARKQYPWTMMCFCSSKKCRKIVKDFPFLPKNAQQKYIKSGFVSEFITKRLHHKI